MHIAVRILFSVVFSAIFIAESQAQSEGFQGDKRKKVALLIGISSYTKANPLSNPLNDVKVLAENLSRIGFQVVASKDPSVADARNAIAAFGAAAKDSDISLVYYAGHGVQIDGENYIVPRDFDPDAREIPSQLISIGGILGALDKISKAKVILLDACRDNPFLDRIAAALPGRSVSRGLASVALPPAKGAAEGQAYGLILGYATQANTVAEDGAGANSPYASALLQAIRTPEEDLGAILVKAARLVIAETGGRQRPEQRVALTQPLYLMLRPAPLDCDLLAAEVDNNISVRGVEYDQIDSPKAVEACTADLIARPDHPRLLHNLARALDKGGRKKEAAEAYLRAATLGYDWAQNNLAVMHLSGDGVSFDPRVALGWMRKAFGQGNRQAIVNYADTDMGDLLKDSPDKTRAFQRALVRGGAPVAETGSFDASTAAAVEEYRKRRGISGAGVTFQLMDALDVTDEILKQ